MVEAIPIIEGAWIRTEALRLSKIAVSRAEAQRLLSEGDHLPSRAMVQQAQSLGRWRSNNRAPIRSQQSPKFRTLPAPGAHKAKEFSR
jgi:hypothetical protein